MDVTKEALEIELARTVNLMQKQVGDRDHRIELLEKELDQLREQNDNLTRIVAILTNAESVPPEESCDQERAHQQTTVDEAFGEPAPHTSTRSPPPVAKSPQSVNDSKLRLYRVEVETEIYCLAECATQAERIAQHNTLNEEFETHATVAEWVSPDWGDCAPYTGPGAKVEYRTCDEWLKDQLDEFRTNLRPNGRDGQSNPG